MKRALLVGVNYRGMTGELNGCINDVHNIRDYLLANGYNNNNIRLITDDTPDKPHRDVILAELLNLLLSGATELFFHYSGHGSRIADRNQDEADRKDECIVPLDYQSMGFITDDQLRGLLTFLKPSAKLVIVLDCCHSGTGFDLAFNFTTRLRWKRERRRWVRRRVAKMAKTRGYLQTDGQAVMLSGCQDRQYSMDAFEKGEYQGAMTYSLLEVLNDGKSKTWEELLVDVRRVLKEGKYRQLPHLSSGRALNLKTKVSI